MANTPYNPYTQLGAGPPPPQVPYNVYSPAAGAPPPQQAPHNPYNQMPTGGPSQQHGAPAPSAPPLFQDNGTDGWQGDEWTPQPSAQLSPEQYHAFAQGANITSTLPSGALFVPMSVNIPEANCLLPHQVDPRLRERSSCLFDVRGINGPEIVGCDPRLNADAEEITRFFISHLKKPCIKVSLQGTHQKREHYTQRDANGNVSHHTRYVTVVDFSFDIDVTPIIGDQWNFITAHPHTWGHTISNYINSTSKIKKLQMHTKVEWDWNNLKIALVNLIRSTYYQGSINVHFPEQRNSLSVMYDNAMTRCANNDCVKIMCIVSCLWIIGWPLKLMLGYDDDSSLTAYYSMTAPWNEFFYRNCNSVFAAVCMKVGRHNQGHRTLPLL